MVQRKLPTNLTLQPQTRTSLSHLHHDMKSPRGADLKSKKMKKSRSIKRPKPPPLTTPPPLPNYMKSTTSSDARKESKAKLGSSSSKKPAKAVARTLTKNPSFKPARSVVVRKRVLCENVDAQRATCSSTLKDCKFPAYLSLKPGGNESTIKVCPYTYCSLNGHHHAPLPPLKCFLSARRRAIKTQRSVKMAVENDDLKSSCVGPVMEEESKDFFVEIYTADGAGVDETVAEDQEERVCDEFEEEMSEELLGESPPDDHFYEQDSDMEWETGYLSPLQLDYDYECLSQTALEPGPEADASDNEVIKDKFTVSSDGKNCCFDENLMNEVSQESVDEEGLSSDAFSSSDDDDDDDDMHNLSSFKTSPPPQLLVEEAEVVDDEEKGKTATDPQTVNQDDEASFDILNHERVQDEPAESEKCVFNKASREDAAETETKGLQIIANSKKLVPDGDEVGALFNPRAPNFLPVEADPEAQKVDLKHQDLDERKNAEEWMVDYALRQVVTKLGPARKRKVSLLVQAFEKVMPETKWDLQLRHASAFDQPRPIQACR